MKILLIGERQNTVGVYRRYSAYNWFRLAQMMPTFRGPKNVVARERLESIGLRWDHALNLTPPGPQGEPFDTKLARRVAEFVDEDKGLRETFKVFVLLGRRAQTAFGISWSPRHGQLLQERYLCVPHPSGLSRFWNDEFDVARCRMMVEPALDDKCTARCCLCRTACDEVNAFCHGCHRHVCIECSELHEKAHMGVHHDSSDS